MNLKQHVSCEMLFFGILGHTQLYMGLLHHRKFQASNEPILGKLMDRQKDGRTDGRTDRPYFTGPFRPRLGVQLTVVWLYFDHAQRISKKWPKG